MGWGQGQQSQIIIFIGNGNTQIVSEKKTNLTIDYLHLYNNSMRF